MELVKRNILSIIFGVIALIAIVALFVPLGGMEEEFQAELKKQAQLDQNVRALLNTPRVKPTIVPGSQTAEPLEAFPSRTIIEQAKGVTDEVRDKSMRAFATAVEINKHGHGILIPGALPTASSAPVRNNFRDAYLACVTPGRKPPLYDPNRPDLGPWNIPDEILRAAKPPTEEEIRWAMQEEWKKGYADRILTSAPPPGSTETLGPPLNWDVIVREYRSNMQDFPQKFRRQRSTQSPMYLEPAALSRAQNMDPRLPNPPNEEDMWYAQVTLWVQQDVALAIKEMNKGSSTVLQSPVKHLGVLDVNQGFAMYELPVAQGSSYATPYAAPPAYPPFAGATDTPPAPTLGPDGQPLPAAAGVEGEIPKVYTKSFTGRVCNPVYDIVHFRLVAVVDARHVRRFIETLQQGRFITVLEVDARQQDLEARRQQGYDYGTQPVVELSILGEAMFLREWTAHGNNAPMPFEVKRKLGVTPKAAPDGSTPAPTVASGAAAYPPPTP